MSIFGTSELFQTSVLMSEAEKQMEKARKNHAAACIDYMEKLQRLPDPRSRCLEEGIAANYCIQQRQLAYNEDAKTAKQRLIDLIDNG